MKKLSTQQGVRFSDLITSNKDIAFFIFFQIHRTADCISLSVASKQFAIIYLSKNSDPYWKQRLPAPYLNLKHDCAEKFSYRRICLLLCSSLSHEKKIWKPSIKRESPNDVKSRCMIPFHKLFHMKSEPSSVMYKGLICGTPESGKTTFLEKFFSANNCGEWDTFGTLKQTLHSPFQTFCCEITDEGRARQRTGVCILETPFMRIEATKKSWFLRENISFVIYCVDSTADERTLSLSKRNFSKLIELRKKIPKIPIIILLTKMDSKRSHVTLDQVKRLLKPKKRLLPPWTMIPINYQKMKEDHNDYLDTLLPPTLIQLYSWLTAKNEPSAIQKFQSSWNENGFAKVA